MDKRRRPLISSCLSAVLHSSGTPRATWSLNRCKFANAADTAMVQNEQVSHPAAIYNGYICYGHEAPANAWLRRLHLHKSTSEPGRALPGLHTVA